MTIIVNWNINQQIITLARNEAIQFKHVKYSKCNYPNLFVGLYMFIDEYIKKKTIFSLQYLVREYLDNFLFDKKKFSYTISSKFFRSIRHNASRYLYTYIKSKKLERFSKQAYRILE